MSGQFRLRGLLALSVWTLWLAIGLAGERFQYGFEKGQAIHYQTKQIMKTSMALQGQQINMTVQTEELTQWTPQESTSQNTFVVEVKSLRLRFIQEMNLPFGKQRQEFDSTKAQKSGGNPLIQVLQRLAKRTLVLHLTPQGKITKVEGLKELFQEMKLPGGQFPVAQMAEGIKDQLGQMVVAFPDKELNPGDTWEVPLKMTLPGIGRMETRMRYRYEGPQDSLARFTFTTSLEGKLNLKTPLGGQVAATVKTTRSQGEFFFDPQKGQMVRLSSQTDLQFTLHLQVGQAQQPLEQQVSIEVELKQVPGPNLEESSASSGN